MKVTMSVAIKTWNKMSRLLWKGNLRNKVFKCWKTFPLVLGLKKLGYPCTTKTRHPLSLSNKQEQELLFHIHTHEQPNYLCGKNFLLENCLNHFEINFQCGIIEWMTLWNEPHTHFTYTNFNYIITIIKFNSILNNIDKRFPLFFPIKKTYVMILFVEKLVI